MAKSEGGGGWFQGAGTAVLGAGVNLLGGGLGVKRQYKYNKKLASYQHKKNMELLKYQLDYNDPESQMARFEEAGLNPNLVYSQGSPGNMEGAPRYPDIKSPDIQGMYAQLGTQVQELKLMQAQTDLTKVKRDESGVKQDLMSAQSDLVRANPFMKPEYVNSLVLQLSSAAKLKEQEKNFMLEQVPSGGRAALDRTGMTSVGYIKMDQELQLLYQKFDLGSADAQLKAKVLESKTFQNALQEIQVKWMQDADITPQHIYQGIMLLLSRLMR